MASPPAARICVIGGALALAIAAVNQGLEPVAQPALQRASVLAGALAVALMLVGSLWNRIEPLEADRAELEGEEGLVLVEDLDDALRQELAWGSQMLLTATPAAVVLVHRGDRTLLRRGLLASTPFVPGPICHRCQERGRAISLVDLRLYPGRDEFAPLLANLPSVLVQPIGACGWLIVGGWSARCFSRSDLIWCEGWARRLAPLIAELNGELPQACD
ncbi:MAG: cofactor assembly of complex C subunit B [Synechococcaceae cyanobacterium]|jgi:hypothetical protein